MQQEHQKYLHLYPFVSLHENNKFTTTRSSKARSSKIAPRCLSLVCPLLASPMAPKGGLKRRLHLESPEPCTSASSSHAAPSAIPMVGGPRRRLAKDESQRPEAALSTDTPLNNSLRRMWALGELSSPQVQELAMGALSQGAHSIDAMAKAGGEGKNKGNMHRALVAAFGKTAGAPDMFYTDIPVVGGRKSPHPFILPHELFGTLKKERPEQFERTILGPEGECAKFWSSAEGKDMRSKHPVLRQRWATDLCKTVPVGLHGDGGPFTKHDSLYTVTWNSLLGVGTTTSKRYIFTVVKKSDLLANGSTWAAIWKIFSWSMNALLTGKNPERDLLERSTGSGGSHIADGLPGALVQVRGDWAFYCEVFGFPKHNEAVNMCWMCRASTNDPQLRYTNATLSAGWRSTIRSHESFLAEHAANGTAPPTLLSLATGLRLEHIMIDVLHIVDQGVASHVIGNVLFEVMRLGQWGRRLADQTAGVSADLNTWYSTAKKAKTSKLQGKLTLERIRTDGGWPKIKAKAAATRHLSEYALAIAQRYDDGSSHSRSRSAFRQSKVLLDLRR